MPQFIWPQSKKITSSSLFRFLQIRWPGDELGGEGIVGERGLERSRQGSQCKLLQGQQCNSIQFNAMQYNSMQYNAMGCNAMKCNAIKCNEESTSRISMQASLS